MRIISIQREIIRLFVIGLTIEYIFSIQLAVHNINHLFLKLTNFFVNAVQRRLWISSRRGLYCKFTYSLHNLACLIHDRIIKIKPRHCAVHIPLVLFI
ncbi:hypothetical protein D3C74_377250 [compost metagenome]